MCKGEPEPQGLASCDPFRCMRHQFRAYVWSDDLAAWPGCILLLQIELGCGLHGEKSDGRQERDRVDNGLTHGLFE
jgi:hypothetical protein